MSTIRFELRIDKIDQDGKAPIRLVYQIGGKRKYFPTNKKCFPFEWDGRNQIAHVADKKAVKKDSPDIPQHLLLNTADASDINESLLDLQRQVEKIEKRFKLDGITYSVEMVIDALKGILKPEEKVTDIKESISGFISRYVEDSSSTHKPGTLKVYTGLQNHIKDYEKTNQFKLTFTNCTLGFFKSFHTFLTKDRITGKGDQKKVIKGMNNITAAKQISTLKTLIRTAKTVYKIEVNPDYQEYRVSRQDGDFEVISLTQDELDKIYSLDLTGKKRLDQVRDVFIFSCSTGLRFSDLDQLRWEHIRNQSIKMTAAKTGQTLDVPLNPYSAAILDKYRSMDLARPLPMISGQKTNDYIKEIGELAGINTPIVITRKYGVKSESITYPKYELLSIHCGRRTFITLSLEKGIAAQVVMKLSGHKTWAAFRRYVEVSEQHKREEMAKGLGSRSNSKASQKGKLKPNHMYTESIKLETTKRVSKYKVIKVEEVFPLSQQIISNFDSEFILNFLLDANEVFHYGYKPSEGEKENSVLHDINELLRNGVFPWIKNPEEGVLYLSKAFLSVYDNNASDGFKTMIELLNEAYINEILNENTSPAMGNRYRSGIDYLKTIHRYFVNIENQ